MKFTIPKILIRLLLLILALAIICSMVISYYKVGVNRDSYYYIEISRLILQGKSLFVDFPPEYTPLTFYLMCIPFAIFGGSFEVGIFTIYLLHLINSYLVYRLCVKFIDNKYLAIFTALFSLLLCWLAGGEAYILEPFVLLFGLVSLLVLHKNKWAPIFLSGLLSFCAFWSKQYGLGFIFIAVVYLSQLNKFNKDLIKKESYLLAGFIFGLILFVSKYLFQGVEINSLSILSGSDYRRDGIGGFIDAWLYTFITIPMLLLAMIMLIYKFKDALRFPLYLMAICGVFGFMLQCYVRFYAHYLILTRPFCVLLILAGLLLIKKETYRRVYTSLFVISLIIPLYFLVKGNLSSIKDNTRNNQIELAKEVAKVIPHGAGDVYSGSDLLPILLLNENGSPYLSKYGPTNGFVVEADQAYDLISHASYCLISDEEYQTGAKYASSVRDYLANNFQKYDIEFKDLDGNLKVYYVYKRQLNQACD